MTKEKAKKLVRDAENENGNYEDVNAGCVSGIKWIPLGDDYYYLPGKAVAGPSDGAYRTFIKL